MRVKETNINKILIWTLVVSAVIRSVLAATIEFGNDEVYYWTYALYPDWSHFDHPPMVGWMIQLFSLNLLLDSEFFIRLASIVSMTICTYLIYRIASDIKDTLTGLYAALLYTASIYAFIITGIFIMPDTPLCLFWLLAFWMAIKFFKNDTNKNTHLILFGLFAGLAILSKYTGAFIWVGMILYILFFNRTQLKNPYLYIAMIISAICCIPILYWNIQNDFISFNFHSDRVGLFGKINLATFGTELAGEAFYNNPVNFVMAIIAIAAVAKKRSFIDKNARHLVLCTTLPLITIFILFSLFRPTLPHWNAPAYNILIILTACYLSDKNPIYDGHFAMPKPIVAAISVTILTAVLGSIEIQTGLIPLDHHEEPEKLGKNDFTLDMYGWKQLETKFEDLRKQKINEGTANEEDGIIANEWFPLANIDYYVARPLNMRVMGLGWPNMLHKYLWINEQRGGFEIGENDWFLSDSHYFKDANKIYKPYFNEIQCIDTIKITRCGKPAKNFFVYYCKELKTTPPTLDEMKTNLTNSRISTR